MNSRVRLLAAINHQPFDRVPTDIWATAEVWAKLDPLFGSRDAALAALHIDGFGGVGPVPYVGPAIPPCPSDETVDYWGMRTKRMHYATGAYMERYFWPLAHARTIDDLQRFVWPRADWWDYSQMRPATVERHQHHAIQCGYMAPFYTHNNLRGLEQSLLDPLDDPEFTHYLLGRISDFLVDHHRRMFEACAGLIDVAQVTDDYGSQTGPLISMEIFREFYQPHLQRFMDLCHSFGIKVMHHDDGAIRPFLPELVKMGIDILNPIQWVCPGMDRIELKQEFGARVCFHGAVENQRILPFGTPEEVRAEVRDCIDMLAGDGTGYILASCHNLQANTPVDNILAMYDEACRYRRA